LAGIDTQLISPTHTVDEIDIIYARYVERPVSRIGSNSKLFRYRSICGDRGTGSHGHFAVESRAIFIVSKFEEKMARVTGLEPATSGVTGRRSNQLSYTRLVFPPQREAFV
jgi:hypothetical protein